MKSGNAESQLEVPVDQKHVDDGGENTFELCEPGATDESCVEDVQIPQAPPPVPELWYLSYDTLVRIVLDTSGRLAQLEQHEVPGLPVIHNSITMLPNGDLVGGRIEDGSTLLFLIESPPHGEPSLVIPKVLGTLNRVALEALYTDCQGRIYGMDTGEDVSSSAGNRLLRFTGEVDEGDFSFEVVSDLSMASVADIDDMGPGIGADGRVTDNPGFAIDTGNVQLFNYESGTGSTVATAGTFGTHVLDGQFFDDGVARLYVLDRDAHLFELDHVMGTLSPSIVQGPEVVGQERGRSGLAGPLTDCESEFTIVIK